MSGLEDYTIKVHIKCKEQLDSPFCLLTKVVPHLPSQKKYHSMFSTPPLVESSNSY